MFLYLSSSLLPGSSQFHSLVHSLTPLFLSSSVSLPFPPSCIFPFRSLSTPLVLCFLPPSSRFIVGSINLWQATKRQDSKSPELHLPGIVTSRALIYTCPCSLFSFSLLFFQFRIWCQRYLRRRRDTQRLPMFQIEAINVQVNDLLQG